MHVCSSLAVLILCMSGLVSLAHSANVTAIKGPSPYFETSTHVNYRDSIIISVFSGATDSPKATTFGKLSQLAYTRMPQRIFMNIPTPVASFQGLNQKPSLSGGNTVYGLYFQVEITSMASVSSSFKMIFTWAQQVSTMLATTVGYMLCDTTAFQAAYPSAFIIQNIVAQNLNSTQPVFTAPEPSLCSSLATRLVMVNLLQQQYASGSCSSMVSYTFIINSDCLSGNPQVRVAINDNQACQSDMGSATIGWEATTMLFDVAALNSITGKMPFFQAETIHLLSNQAYSHYPVQKTTLFYGLRQFAVQSLTFDFSLFMQTDSTNVWLNETANMPDFSITRSYAASVTWFIHYQMTCPRTNPFYYQNLCYDVCPAQTYPSLTACICLPCANAFCQSCSASSNTTCLLCLPNFTLSANSTKCIPTNSYYLLNALTVSPCADANCLQCVDGSSCSKCASLFYLDPTNTTCFPCNHNIVGCATCSSNGTLCLTCLPSYTMFDLNMCQVTCSIPGCLTCVNYFCTQCLKFGFTWQNGICSENCGDGFIIGVEQCDDGNLNSYDGCSSACKKQANFTCSTNPTARSNTSSTANCKYTSPVYFEFKSLTKVQGLNQILVVVAVPSQQSFLFENVNLWQVINYDTAILQLVQINVNPPGPPVQVIFSRRLLMSLKQRLLTNSVASSSSLLSITFSYSQTIQSSLLSLSLNFSQTNLSVFSITPASNISMNILPDNNQLAVIYTAQQYAHAESLKYFVLTVTGFAMIVFFVSLFLGGNIIMLETVGLLQLAYVSLIGVGGMGPSMASLLPLKYSLGVNVLAFATSPIEDTSTSIVLKGMGVYSQFDQNFNLSALAFIIPLLAAVIVLLIQKLPIKIAKKNRDKLQAIFKKSIGEFALLGLLFCVYAVSFFLTVQILYGMSSNNFSIFGLVFGVGCVLCLIGYLIFYLKNPEYFGQFSSCLNNQQSPALARKIIAFLLLQRIANGALAVLLASFSFQAFIPIVLFLFYMTLVLKGFPYTDFKQNIRAASNCVVIILVEVVYLVERVYQGNTQSQTSLALYLPVTVAVLLTLAVFVNSVMSMRIMYKYIRKQLCRKGKCAGDVEKQSTNLENNEELKKFREEIYGDEISMYATNHHPLHYTSDKKEQEFQIKHNDQTGELLIMGEQSERSSTKTLVGVGRVNCLEENQFEDAAEEIGKIRRNQNSAKLGYQTGDKGQTVSENSDDSMKEISPDRLQQKAKQTSGQSQTLHANHPKGPNNHKKRANKQAAQIEPVQDEIPVTAIYRYTKKERCLIGEEYDNI